MQKNQQETNPTVQNSTTKLEGMYMIVSALNSFKKKI